MFFEFRQNNPGGTFNGPAQTVYVEANSYDEANKLFLKKVSGTYFNGVASGKDCECCGDRWTPVDEEWSKYDVTNTLEDCKDHFYDTYAKTAVVYLLDGKTQSWTQGSKF